jgi:hypothetical protein
MPEAATTHVYEIKLFGQCITEETVNVFFYGTDAILDTTPNDLLNAFDTNVAAVIATLVSVDMLFNALTCQEVKGGTQFGSIPIFRNGPQTGDCLPPFVAFDFTLVRGGALERNGYKRIPGVPEALQAQGIITGAGSAVANTVAAAMFTNITAGLIEFFPLIQRKHIAHIPQNPPKYYNVSGVQYSRIGTQNSRKFGHGR